MKAESTEFRHVHQLFNRIALSRFEVGFSLRHNQRRVQELRMAADERERERRIAQVCGDEFIGNAVFLEESRMGLRLWGWVGLPAFARTQADLQYLYVNGRPVRDKLLGHALRRADAQVGDDIWISGTLGDATLALAGYLNDVPLTADELATAARRMHAPTPRVALGLALAGAPDTGESKAGAPANADSASVRAGGAHHERLAHAALDISDGLIGDLGHILKASNVGATLDADALPAGPALATQPQDLRRRYTAAGGDDYELCFTAPAAHRAAIAAAGVNTGTRVTRVGTIDAARGLRFVDAAGQPLDLDVRAWDHFSAE